MTVICYAATHGDYSDFCVAAVFSTREKADAWRATHDRTVECYKCKGTGKLFEIIHRALTTDEREALAAQIERGDLVATINGSPATVGDMLGMATIHQRTTTKLTCDRCGGAGTVVENEYDIVEYDLDPEPEEVTP